MKNFPTQKEFLEAELRTNPIADVIQLKQAYKKAYHKEYNQRRKKGKSLRLRLSNDEYKKIKKLHASYKQYSLNKLLVSAILAYESKNYLSHNLKEIEQLRIDVNKIGNNINQVVHKLHVSTLKVYPKNEAFPYQEKQLKQLLEAFVFLKKEVEKIKKLTLAYVRSPAPKLLDLEWEDIRYDKKKLRMLSDYLREQSNRL